MSRGGERCACFGRRVADHRFGFAGSRCSGGVAERRSLSSCHEVKRALACADGVVRWPGQRGLTLVSDQFMGPPSSARDRPARRRWDADTVRVGGMVGAVVPKTAQVCLRGATLVRMRRVIVSDYDGTITESSPALLPGLRRFLAAGHLFVLCSGRYAEWAEECPLGALCARLVLENGGCLIDGEGVRELGPAPTPELVAALLQAGYAHDHGRVIVGMRSADEPGGGDPAALRRRSCPDQEQGLTDVAGEGRRQGVGGARCARRARRQSRSSDRRRRRGE